ncbi:MAG: tetratricopeptide repeat protein, partial [Candidatus Thiodiazotropha endolucinida]
EINDQRGKANCLGNLGNTWAELGNEHKAITSYEQALIITREINDQNGEANALYNIAISTWQLNRREDAINLAQEALDIFSEIESPNVMVVSKTLSVWRAQ